MRGRSYTIGATLADFTSPLPARSRPRRDRRTSSGTSFTSILISGGSEAAASSGATEALIDRQVDGLILNHPLAATPGLRNSVRAFRVAWWAVTAPRPTTTPSAATRRRRALVVDHLVGLGHRRIGLSANPTLPVWNACSCSHTARQAVRGRHAATWTRTGCPRHVLVRRVAIVAAGRPWTSRARHRDLRRRRYRRARGVRRRRSATSRLRRPVGPGGVRQHLHVNHRSGLADHVDQGRPAHWFHLRAATFLQRINDGRTQPVHYILPPSGCGSPAHDGEPDDRRSSTPPALRASVCRVPRHPQATERDVGDRVSRPVNRLIAPRWGSERQPVTTKNPRFCSPAGHFNAHNAQLARSMLRRLKWSSRHWPSWMRSSLGLAG